jgi:hypothetical protein
MFEIVERSNSQLAAGESGRNVRLEYASATPSPQKLFLPKRQGEPPFAPQQYYYPASKSGALPLYVLAGSRIERARPSST